MPLISFILISFIQMHATSLLDFHGLKSYCSNGLVLIVLFLLRLVVTCRGIFSFRLLFLWLLISVRKSRCIISFDYFFLHNRIFKICSQDTGFPYEKESRINFLARVCGKLLFIFLTSTIILTSAGFLIVTSCVLFLFKHYVPNIREPISIHGMGLYPRQHDSLALYARYFHAGALCHFELMLISKFKNSYHCI